MALDPMAVGSKAEPYRATWTRRDAMTYAIAVGAGVDELAYSTENTEGHEQQVFPTFAGNVGHGPDSKRATFGSFDPTSTFYGGLAITLHKPLPVEGDVTIVNGVAAMYDKGDAAVVELESAAVDNVDGGPLFTRRSSLYVAAGGGWGGDRGPSGDTNAPPGRTPDLEVSYPTSRDQALIYRLTGDHSRVHSDPALAAQSGFDRPTLHGACTFGFTGRALLHALCGGESARFHHIEGRFSKPVFPGDTLTVRIWHTDPGRALFSTWVGDRVVISRGMIRFAA